MHTHSLTHSRYDGNVCFYESSAIPPDNKRLESCAEAEFFVFVKENPPRDSELR